MADPLDRLAEQIAFAVTHAKVAGPYLDELRDSDVKLATQAAVASAVQLAMIQAMRATNPEMVAVFTERLRRLALEADSRLPEVEPQLNALADLAESGRSPSG